MIRWQVACVVFIACGHAPPPPPAPVEQPVTGAASFSGRWVADDDLDWGYALAVGGDGKLRLVIDRGKMGRCEQAGRLEQAASPKLFRLVYEKNTCSPDLAGASVEITVASYTGTSLTLAIRGDGSQARRTYLRDPKPPVTEP